MRSAALTLLLFLPSLATAQIAPECADFANDQPADYDEQVQQDFLANYVALSMTYSPAHAPIPHEPGHGAVGVGLQVIPPLGCGKRFVLDWTKTEDTNKTPVAPVPRVTFAFPTLGPVHLYGGVGYLPPVTILGTRNVIFQAEFGGAVALGEEEQIQVGARIHSSSIRTIADVATAFVETDPAVLDLYLGSSVGAGLMGGYALKELGITPYASVGFTDISTFFFIGDDGLIANNLHPYAGLDFSLGVDGLTMERLRWAFELYGAPGGVSVPKAGGDNTLDISNVDGANYGSLYTARIRLGFEL